MITIVYGICSASCAINAAIALWQQEPSRALAWFSATIGWAVALSETAR